jgi:hypothetical protein
MQNTWLLFIIIALIFPFTYFVYHFLYHSSDGTGSKPLSRPHSESESKSHAAAAPLVTEGECTDPEWCNIPMPTKSYFRMTPPSDPERWKQASLLAMQGDHILLKRILPFFPHQRDFLDGDTLFRSYHLPIDYYMDMNRDFRAFRPGGLIEIEQSGKTRKKYSFEKPGNHSVIPPIYDFRSIGRAPIAKLGYFAFTKYGNRNHYFAGGHVGEAVIDRNKFLKMWQESSPQLTEPFILLHSSNENWGLLSTLFPNRTADWGKCCQLPGSNLIYQFLDHPKTLMMLTNQHHNVTHPKLITLPRGVPLQFPQTSKLLWDSMYFLSETTKKTGLLFSSSSTWGYRPKLVECISSKFPNRETDIVSAKYEKDLKGRMPPNVYYERLGTSKFSLALPGLGYDTFR